MGKKGGKDGSTTSGGAECRCEDPYECQCGHRPPRPSRGHKWDGERWGGKGHKQKGGGQAAVKGNGEPQWQRLPSALLAEYCAEQKRPSPKYKLMDKFRYRVILPDAKRGREHDVILMPTHAVHDDDQAKQEAALLALLHFTPNMPHERRLPHPYKTTWLRAIRSTTTPKQQQQPARVEGEATASTNLVPTTSYASQAERKQQWQLNNQKRLQRIRHFEAHQMANPNHHVFMTASIRKQLEHILRDETNMSTIRTLATQSQDDEDEDDVRQFVVQRLVQEGFTTSQANTAYSQLQPQPSYWNDNTDDDVQNTIDERTEECFQWLCIHLNEDQLPQALDPRGRTLDVIASSSTADVVSGIGTPNNNNNDIVDNLMQLYGVTFEEATVLSHLKDSSTVETVLYQALCKAADICSVEQVAVNGNGTTITEMAAEELEALGAIFSPDECTISQNNECTIITIQLSPNGDRMLQIQMKDGRYPHSSYPCSILIKGGWEKKKKNDNQAGCGTAIHIELLKFMSTLTLGNPMVYELYGFVQSHFLQQQQQTNDDMPSYLQRSDSTLLRHLPGGHDLINKEQSRPPFNLSRPNDKRTVDKRVEDGNNDRVGDTSKMAPRIGSPTPSMMPQRSVHKIAFQRPREKSSFWSKPPDQVKPAIAFPKISTLLKNARNNLPAAKARSNFLSILSQLDGGGGGGVMLITGETGCGKTTQIPQFILEQSPRHAKIVVTQPRRLAAIGVSERVAKERGEVRAGLQSVGYIVRGDVALCDDTRLLFCTTGVLLRQLQSQDALDCITHIVVDEVHERQLDSDILLGVLKELLATKKAPHLRVILMSATMDADRFAKYWGSNTPRMHIPGFTHPVEDFMLEDVLSITGYIPPKKGKSKKKNGYQSGGGGHGNRHQSPWDDSEKSEEENETDNEKKNEETVASKSSGSSAFTLSSPQSHGISIVDLLKRVDENRIDYDLIGILVRHLVQTKDRNDEGSILVFLPGAPEITKAEQAVRRIAHSHSLLILPLHGGLQAKDQQLVFRNADIGTTKVILSTNIAETSITIPDCTVVIDTCREKQSSYDPSNRMPMLVERFASRDSLTQRRGRAGRVRPGTCYKLITSSTHSKLPEHGEPEIRRCALDQTLLSLLFLGMEQGSGNFLMKLLDPPSWESINAAIYSLTKLGAVTSAKNNEEGTIILTSLGMHLAGIPAPPTVGKILVMGCLLGCRSAGLAIASGMSLGRSPFLKVDSANNNSYKGKRSGGDADESAGQVTQKRIMGERAKLFKSVGNSDHAMLAAAYITWDNTTGDAGSKKGYCELLGLSYNGMRDMKQLVKQLDSSLCSAGYYPTTDSERNAESWRIIRSCVVSALAPSQLVRVERPSTKYAETAEGAIEKDGVAREFKFYIRGDANAPPVVWNEGNANDDSTCNVTRRYHGIAEERVFVHPSSMMFSVGSYSCPWLVYHELVRTSKPFLRDATESSSYALLLFGGAIEIQSVNGLIVIDDYVRLSANARIGALIGGLRRKIDHVLMEKVANPSLDIASSVEMKLIVKLLMSDGLGQ